MDTFRSATKLWSEATGAIDADSNFRPIQTNPSCIWTCSDPDSVGTEWCPEVAEDIEYPADYWHYEEGDHGPSDWPNIEGGEICGHEQQSPISIDSFVRSRWSGM